MVPFSHHSHESTVCSRSLREAKGHLQPGEMDVAAAAPAAVKRPAFPARAAAALGAAGGVQRHPLRAIATDILESLYRDIANKGTTLQPKQK